MTAMDGVQLSGTKLVPSTIEEDHSLLEGSGDAIKLPDSHLASPLAHADCDT